MASWYIKPRPRSKTHVTFVEVAAPAVGIQFLLSEQNMNPLLDFTGLPRFAEIKPEHVAPATEQLLAENRALIARLLSDLSLIHISEPTRLGMISYAVFCLKKKKKKKTKKNKKNNTKIKYENNKNKQKKK